MDTLTFLGLQATEDPWCWRLPVVPSISSGMGALFGGCGLAAGVEAMERATGRPLVWATAQFFDYARPPSIIDIAVTEVVRGHQVSQALASLRVTGPYLTSGPAPKRCHKRNRRACNARASRQNRSASVVLATTCTPRIFRLKCAQQNCASPL